MVAGVWSDESTLQLEATTQFRKLLSIGEYKTISFLVCVCVFFFSCGSTRVYIPISMFFCTIERSPPIEEVIQSGVVPRFVEFLMREDFPQLQVSTPPPPKSYIHTPSLVQMC